MGIAAEREREEAKAYRAAIRTARQDGERKGRADIVLNLLRRAGKREARIETFDHGQEVEWLRKIAAMIEAGTEGDDP